MLEEFKELARSPAADCESVLMGKHPCGGAFDRA